MVFKYVELFAGIGGFRQALDPLGGECVFASEIDPFATRAYKALYGGLELHGDITKIDAHDIPDHDVLVGGFPCQAFSIAGQRKGFEEARGTLFFEIARIASAKQPALMLLENVKGLLSHDGGNTFETMCVVLNDIGYAIDFCVLNSKHYGVPQNRERIFVVCDRDAEHSDWSIEGNGVEAKAKRRAQALGIRTFNFDWPTNDTVTTRLRDVLETDVDEKYYLSEEKTAKLIAKLTETVDSDDCEMIGHIDGINGHDICRRVHSPTGVAPTIPTGSSGNTMPKIAEAQIVQRSRGYNAGGFHDIAPTLTSRSYQENNHVIEPRLEQYTDGSGLASTVYANYAKGTSPGDIGKGRRTHVIEEFTVIQKTHSTCTTVKYDETGTLQAARLDKVPQVAIGKSGRYRIRKLTPRECWRLQGFSDAAHDTVAAAGISDSQRYKQAGNAVTVNVISAISRRLIPLLTKEEALI